MYAIKLTAAIGEDRRLVIDLPADAPTGDVELIIREVMPKTADNTIAREIARAKLQTILVRDLGIPDDIEMMSDDDLEMLGQLPPGARSSEELVDEDRGQW